LRVSATLTFDDAHLDDLRLLGAARRPRDEETVFPIIGGARGGVDFAVVSAPLAASVASPAVGAATDGGALSGRVRLPETGAVAGIGGSMAPLPTGGCVTVGLHRRRGVHCGGLRLRHAGVAHRCVKNRCTANQDPNK